MLSLEIGNVSLNFWMYTYLNYQVELIPFIYDLNIPVDPMKPWYVKQNVGINKIKEKLIAMLKSAELSVQYTNHSLRATAISRMYGGGIPEKVIIEKSGHKSIKALRTYERTTAE